MSEALIPFGRHLDSDLVVSVDEVARGLACNCICLFCDEPLVAKKGREKQHYFAHKSRSSNDEKHCEASFSRSVFWMIRRILTESNKIRLPKYSLKLDIQYQGLKKEYKVTNESTIEYLDPIFPNELEDYGTDVTVVSIEGTKLAICFNLETGGCSESIFVDDKKIACISIDLSGLKDEFRKRRYQFRSILEEYILYGIDKKKWEYHPREEIYRKEHERLTEHRTIKRFSNSQPIKKQRSTSQNQKPPLNVTLSAEAQETRIRQLIDWARELHHSGVLSAWLCNQCKVLRVPEEKKCKYCNCEDFETVDLNPMYFEHIEQKYRCWNYGIYSASNLKDWPNPKIKK